MTVTGNLFNYVNDRVPRELKHYSLTMNDDREQVVVDRLWITSKVYWGFMEEYDEDYVEQRERLKKLKPGELLPEGEILLVPIIGITRAREELATFNYKVGADHVDQCPTCWGHELHMKLGQDIRANAAAKRSGEEHKAAKDIHKLRSQQAYVLAEAEMAACLKQAEDAKHEKRLTEGDAGPHGCHRLDTASDWRSREQHRQRAHVAAEHSE